MIHLKKFLPLVFSACIILGACSYNAEKITDTPLDDSLTANIVTEPVKQEMPKEDDDTAFVYKTDVILADKNTIPQVYSGYFIIKTTDNDIAIIDKNGEEATEHRYQSVTYTKDNRLLLVDKNGLTETFGYAIGKEPINEVVGQGKPSTRTIAYNVKSGDVVETYSNSITDGDWKLCRDKGIGTYIIKTLEETLHSTGSNDIYYWNTYTNKVYGPYIKPSNLTYDIFMNQTIPYTGIYPVKSERDTLWQVVDKDKITDKEYSKAVLVGNNAVFGINGKTCVLSKGLDAPVILPETAELSTDINDTTVMVLESGVWKMYEADTKDKQE